MKLTNICRVCGFQSTMDDGQDVVAMLHAMDQAHDLVRPKCSVALSRSAAAVVSKETE